MTSISQQMIRKNQKDSQLVRTKKNFNLEKTISTGSTLLDLAISGGRVRKGGFPGGMLVEIFGPSQTGKTVLLCEIAGDIQRKGGQIKFSDPEARLNKKFATLFDLNVDLIEYDRPSTVPEVFSPIHSWEPKGEKGTIHGLVADSLAALSTDLEMEKEEGDKMGMRRAKEFSEQLRKACRIIAQKNLLIVCSNQVRENADAGPYSPKHSSTGGMAIGFYASTRLRMMGSEKIYKETTFKGKKVKKVVGIKTMIEVFKNSVWEAHHTAVVYILFDYGIDDIRANLQYVKDYSGVSYYSLGGNKLHGEMAEAIKIIEENQWEEELKNEVIDLWNAIERKFKTTREPKRR